MSRKIRILLGGLGDDAHSVGITLLKWFLTDAGFHVTFLGIQNTAKQFLERAHDHQVVFISCLNGHAELYINGISSELKKVNNNRIWYIGGNLSVSKNNDDVIQHFMNEGFTRVFPKPVQLEDALALLKQDIEHYNIYPDDRSYDNRESLLGRESNIEFINDDTLDSAAFEKERIGILSDFYTGRDVNELEVKRNLTSARNLSDLLWHNKLYGKSPLVQPRTGVADLVKQLELFRKLVRNNIAVLSVQLDAATRRNYYKVAEEGLIKSIVGGESYLNGFPIPVHGVQGVKKIVETFKMPFQVRGGAPDHRFTYEISMAGGATGVEGAFICYLFPYDKLTRPSDSLHYWKYIDCLAASYLKRFNVLINREFFGPLTSTLIEPCIPIVINIVQALLCAKQGVRSISLGYAEQGCREQDIAAVQIMEQLANAYLYKYGYYNCQVTTVFHQYMAAFPGNENKAEELIRESTITATLANATKIMTKTPVESIKIPSVDDNIRGVKLTYEGIAAAGDIRPDREAIVREKALLKEEVVCIMNAIESLGNGHFSRGIILAFEKGMMDIPFSPSMYNRGETMTFRSISGAVRFANCRHMPFSNRIKDFHEEALLVRKNNDNEKNIVKIMEKDIVRIWKNEYVRWPLTERSLH